MSAPVSANKLSGVLQIDSGVAASLSNLSVINGSGTTWAGISNAGSLTLTNTTISGNYTTFNLVGITCFFSQEYH
jgi:hypothetical protein